MKYCQQCGAQIPDEANFCRSCGAKVAPKVSARTSDDGEGIVIDAPKEAKVTISGETKAPDTSGEFSVASWEEEQEEQPQEVREPKRAKAAPKTQAPPRVERPVETERVVPEENTEKRVGIFSIIWTFIKVMVIVLSIVFSAVIIKGFFKSDTPETPNKEQQEQPMQPIMPNTNTQEGLDVLSGNETNESETIVPNNNVEEDEVIFEKNDDDEGNGSFGKIEDMPLPERVEYFEGLLERSEQYLQEELAKGDAANQDEIRQLRKDIDMIRKALSEIKQ